MYIVTEYIQDFPDHNFFFPSLFFKCRKVATLVEKIQEQHRWMTEWPDGVLFSQSCLAEQKLFAKTCKLCCPPTLFKDTLHFLSGKDAIETDGLFLAQRLPSKISSQPNELRHVLFLGRVI